MRNKDLRKFKSIARRLKTYVSQGHTNCEHTAEFIRDYVLDPAFRSTYGGKSHRCFADAAQKLEWMAPRLSENQLLTFCHALHAAALHHNSAYINRITDYNFR